MIKRLLLTAAALLMAVSCYAGDRKVPTVTQRQVETLAYHWQHELRLDDWAVYVHIVRLSELRPGTAGNSYRNTQHRVMQINVLDPRDYHLIGHKAGKQIVADMRDTVVHELLHLRVADITIHLDESEELSAAEETLVVRLTAALLKETILP